LSPPQAPSLSERRHKGPPPAAENRKIDAGRKLIREVGNKAGHQGILVIGAARALGGCATGRGVIDQKLGKP
jgi:hypothetical protein